jgi:hypothetical protein
MVAVFPGTALTLANDFRLKIRFSKVDFPTLERPANAISIPVHGGNCENVPYEA